MTASYKRETGTSTALNSRAGRALRARHNWVQLAKFCTVGGSGYVVNMAVYAFALDVLGLKYYVAATVSFLVAVVNNYLWNRVWTFRDQRGHFGYQGFRFFVVSTAVYAANILLLLALVALGLGEVVSQACAIVLVTPINFIGNKLWSFRT
ncbi:MAG TPA: GtrA family protein [Gaiellaceae bacterium]|jgi:putative flippase GtrA